MSTIRRTATAEATLRHIRTVLRDLDANPATSKADAIAAIKDLLGPERVPFRVLHDRTGTDWSAA